MLVSALAIAGSCAKVVIGNGEAPTLFIGSDQLAVSLPTAFYSLRAVILFAGDRLKGQ